MVKKEYGEFSNQYAVMFNKYVIKYRDGDGISMVDSRYFVETFNGSDNLSDV